MKPTTTADGQALAINAHLKAAKMLITAGLAQYQRELPEEYLSLVSASNDGALFTLTTSLSVQGLVEIAISITTPDAQTINLLNVAFGTHEPSLTMQ